MHDEQVGGRMAEEATPGRHGLQTLDQFRAARVLQYVAARARFERRTDVFLGPVRRQHDHAAAKTLHVQVAHQGDAGPVRQRNVGQDDRRPQQRRHFERLADRARLADDFEFRIDFEERPQALAQDDMVFDQENPNRGERRAPGRGRTPVRDPPGQTSPIPLRRSTRSLAGYANKSDCRAFFSKVRGEHIITPAGRGVSFVTISAGDRRERRIFLLCSIRCCPLRRSVRCIGGWCLCDEISVTKRTIGESRSGARLRRAGLSVGSAGDVDELGGKVGRFLQCAGILRQRRSPEPIQAGRVDRARRGPGAAGRRDLRPNGSRFPCIRRFSHDHRRYPCGRALAGGLRTRARHAGLARALPAAGERLERRQRPWAVPANVDHAAVYRALGG